jgi:hypothetical protein
MREYRRRKRLEEDIFNNVPKRSYMPNDSVNIEEQTKTYLLNTRVITENAKPRKNLREIKHHKHLRQLTRHQLQIYTIVIKRMIVF